MLHQAHNQLHNREVADSRTWGIFIQIWHIPLWFNEAYKVILHWITTKYAISRMKMPHVLESTTSPMTDAWHADGLTVLTRWQIPQKEKADGLFIQLIPKFYLSFKIIKYKFLFKMLFPLPTNNGQAIWSKHIWSKQLIFWSSAVWTKHSILLFLFHKVVEDNQTIFFRPNVLCIV